MEFTKSESQLGKIAKWRNWNMDFTIWQSELGKQVKWTWQDTRANDIPYIGGQDPGSYKQWHDRENIVKSSKWACKCDW
jgi:hypothetical protein